MPFLFHSEHNIQTKDPSTQAKMRIHNILLFVSMFIGIAVGSILLSPAIVALKVISFFKTQNNESESNNG